MSETVEKLRCELTEKERVAKGEELARVAFVIKALEDEKQAVARNFAERIKAKKELAAELAYDVQSGTELRPVKCFERPRYGDLLVDVVRSDSKEVVRTRAMQPSERQTSLEQRLRELAESDSAEPEPDDETEQTH